MLGPTSSTLLRGSRVNNLVASRCLGLNFASRSNINGRPMQETEVSSPLQLRSFRECSLTRCNRSSSCRTLLAAGRYNETLIAQAHLQQPESTSAIVGYEVVEELGGSGGRREKLVGTVVDVSTFRHFNKLSGHLTFTFPNC